MTTDTDLANAALGHLGEMPISSIDDLTSKPARVCREFRVAALRETLRMGRWNSATKRATLARVATTPSDAYPYAYQLPADLVRLLEVNGESAGAADEFMEIEGARLVVATEAVVIRYVAEVPIGQCDALLQNAVALRLAAKVAFSLTGKADMGVMMTQLFGKALAEARQSDAQEVGSGEKSGWARVFSRSRLLGMRRNFRNPQRLEDY